MKKRLLLFLLLSAVLVSCEDMLDGKNNHGNFNMKINSNRPVPYGSELWVKIEPELEDYDYKLYLPDGSLHTSTSFEVAEARSIHEGFYKVEVSGSNRFTCVDSMYLEVLPASITCNPQVNTLSGWPLQSFRQVRDWVDNNGQYNVVALSSEAELYITFPDDEKARESTYRSNPYTSVPDKDEVVVSMVKGFELWFGKKGERLHVTEEDGYTYFTFCDFEMLGSSETSLDCRIRL